MTKPIDIPALRAKYDATTKGEWSMLATPHKRVLKTGPTVVLGMVEADAAFAVAAHAALPALLDELAQLRFLRVNQRGQIE